MSENVRNNIFKYIHNTPSHPHPELATLLQATSQSAIIEGCNHRYHREGKFNASQDLRYCALVDRSIKGWLKPTYTMLVIYLITNIRTSYYWSIEKFVHQMIPIELCTLTIGGIWRQSILYGYPCVWSIVGTEATTTYNIPRVTCFSSQI